jgi:hypothetical protein
VLVQARLRAQQQHTELVLVCPSPRVRRVLELTGLLELFTLVTSAEEALSERGKAGGSGRRPMTPGSRTQPQPRLQGRIGD